MVRSSRPLTTRSIRLRSERTTTAWTSRSILDTPETFDQFERVVITDITGEGELYDEYGGYWDIFYDGADTHLIAEDGTYLANNILVT